MTGICIDLVADRLWLVAAGTVRPFEGDLDDYRRLVLERGARAGDGTADEPDSRRNARRRAAEKRRELDPLRDRARRAEEAIGRLTKERSALERGLAEPQASASDRVAMSAALKRRAELIRLIARAETEWLAAAEALERESAW